MFCVISSDLVYNVVKSICYTEADIIGSMETDKVKEYNLYCDESCYLQNDKSNVMGLGAVYIPKRYYASITSKIKDIKLKHNIPRCVELKWTKASLRNLDLYKDLINYFFDENFIWFRGIIADKTILDHEKFNQTHDDWYYKIYYELIKVILDEHSAYSIYIDKKDRYSNNKALTLRDVLCRSKYDFFCDIISKIQPIESREVEIMQITDILTGALVFENRIFINSNEGINQAKKELINLIKERSGLPLNRNSSYSARKFNIFFWGRYD